MARNTEAEPFVAAAPGRPGHLVAAWQQDHWSNDGAVGIGGAVSTDYGRTWTRSVLPFSRCVRGGLPYHRAYDSWLSIGPDGTVYASAISTDTGDAAAGPYTDAVAVSTSADGGSNWRRPRIAFAESGSAGHADKDAVTADPTRPGRAYLVWDVATAAGARGYLSTTTDYGASWSTPRVISGRGGGRSFDNVIVADPRSGKLYDFYTLFAPGGAHFQVVGSSDGGATWGAPVTIAKADPAPVAGVRSGAFISSTAIDPATGRLYAAFATRRFGAPAAAASDIALTTSATGSTWSAPTRVSTGATAFTPAVSVGAGGGVAVGYYDTGNATATMLPARYRLRVSPAGGRGFGPPATLRGPFNMRAAPEADGHFLGDYDGLAATGGSFVAVFAATNCTGTCAANPTDIYAATWTP